MKKYWLVFQNSISQSMTYRGEILFRAIRHLIILIMFLSLWGAVFKTKKMVAGYGFNGIVTYYILAEIVDMLYTSKPARLLTKQIKNGELNNFLIKPINYWLLLLFQILGEQIATSSLSILLVIFTFILFPQFIFVQKNIVTLAIFISGAVLAWFLSFQFMFIIGLTTFWFSETNYVRIAGQQLVNLFGGKWLPLVFFSGIISSVVSLMPFQYLFNFLINIYLGILSSGQLSQGLSIEAAWILGLVFLGRFLWNKGILKYEAYGQ